MARRVHAENQSGIALLFGLRVGRNEKCGFKLLAKAARRGMRLCTWISRAAWEYLFGAEKEIQLATGPAAGTTASVRADFRAKPGPFHAP